MYEEVSHKKDEQWIQQALEHTSVELKAPEHAWENIRQQLYTSGHIRPKGNRRLPKYALAAVFLLCFTVVSVVITDATTSWQLFNDEGSILLELKENDEEINTYRENEELVSQVYDQLKPGQGVQIFIKENNPQRIVTVYTEPYAYSTEYELEQNVSFDLFTPNHLPAGFSFYKGEVQFHPVHPDLNDIYDKAKHTESSFVTKEVELSDEISRVSLFYKKDNKTIHLSMTRVTGEGEYVRMYDDLHKRNVQKHTLHNGLELFSIQGAEDHQLVWVSPDKTIIYELFAPKTSELTSEELVQMVKSIQYDQ